MDNPNNSREELRTLYPKLTEEELAQVEETLDRYLKLVIEIVERSQEDHS